MKNKYNTSYFKSSQLYIEKHEFKYMDATEKRSQMHICFNIDDQFFRR